LAVAVVGHLTPHQALGHLEYPVEAAAAHQPYIRVFKLPEPGQELQDKETKVAKAK
jgi:hypothetical protein